jgi:hypothetical protein
VFAENVIFAVVYPPPPPPPEGSAPVPPPPPHILTFTVIGDDPITIVYVPEVNPLFHGVVLKLYGVPFIVAFVRLLPLKSFKEIVVPGVANVGPARVLTAVSFRVIKVVPGFPSSTLTSFKLIGLGAEGVAIYQTSSNLAFSSFTSSFKSLIASINNPTRLP